MDVLSKVIKLFFGSKVDKDRKEIMPYVEKINEVYPSISKLTNDELRERSKALSKAIADFIAEDEARIAKRIPCRKLDTAQDIRDWNDGKIPVAIAHPGSIGHGLNLQYGGHILIWFGLTWSLELYQQANERLNRPGQTSVCRIFHIVLKGTHDERVLSALARKEKGQTAAIEALRLEVLKGANL